MYELYCKLRDEKGYKDADIVKATKISASTFTDWKNGRSKPNTEKLIKIAQFLNVSVEYLTGNSKIIRCPQCGMEYDESDNEDRYYHQKEHTSWEKATEKFGTLYCITSINEKIKSQNRTIVHDASQSLTNRCNAQLEIFRCLFSRSVSANGFSLKHIMFEEYVAMLLHNEHHKKHIATDVYTELKNIYGTKPGINKGTIYEVPAQQSIAVAAHKDEENFTPEELQKIEEYKKLIIAARPKE